jgi:putative lipoprotein
MFTCSSRGVLGLSATVILLSTATASAADDDPFFGRDKALHFVAAGSVAGAGYAVTTAFTDDRWKAFAIGGGAAVAAGALKEGLDAAGLGDPSWKDFAWDVFGAAAGLGVAWVIDVAAHGGHVPALTAATETPRAGAATLRIIF